MPEPRTTVLHERHAQLGAAFTDFGGWLMPVRYGSDLAEHRRVRETAGLFDISHMAEFWVTGDDAADLLDYALAGAMSPMPVGKAKYALLLAEDGGIIDDLIVYRTAQDAFLVVANAGNHDPVAVELEHRRAAWADAHGRGPHLEDVSEQYALLAVQGPLSREILEATAGVMISGTPLATLAYYAWTEGTFAGASLFVARTGYTGEDGFELLIPTAAAGELWDALLAAGIPLGLAPAGLAARDTLRLEAGMPLYGHELTRDTRPAQAGLARAVAADKADFVGKAALAATDLSTAPVLVGLASDGKRAGRAGYAVFDGDERVGKVTSGALSPTLGHPIAMALVLPAAAAPGTELTIDVRGARIPATVTTLPFYRRKK
ncbi:glycine cleavage system aminomethyltransferase GcvT [Microbacterium sp. P04]|uniref:glycine cleavage system aminomethyltransferase GcvT n=1 Tax=Microbacterium sp. P04 TaxID=3366947 RepID=UPI003746B269